MTAHQDILHSAASELRQSIITQEWVIIAKNRGKRPDHFKAQERVTPDVTRDDPFLMPQDDDVLLYRDADNAWTTRVFPNKYPAVEPSPHMIVTEEGPYTAIAGIGAHEIVVTRDPIKHIGQLDLPAVAEVIDAYQDRYIAHMRSSAIRYVSIFHNHGVASGASIPHPHSQIIALPIVPTVVQRELDVVRAYAHAHHISPFAVMSEFERSAGTRMITQNEHFMAFCPYASQAAFNVWVMPVVPQPYFERITDVQKMALAQVLHDALAAIDCGLAHPDFNFFLHTAPCDGWNYDAYSWYIDIMPRTAKIAGFELATSMEIVAMPPEEAAAHLRTCLVRKS